MTDPTSGDRIDADSLVRWRGRAPAKTNLFLEVLDREASGFHGLETLFQELELADELELTLIRHQAADDESRIAGERLDVEGLPVWLDVEGVGADALGANADNLVIRALAAILRAGVPHVDGAALRIRLVKRIPHGAGLGGGSSDAATMLLAVNELFGFPLESGELMGLGGELGSDVPFFLSASPLALAWGRGHRMLSLPPLPARPVLLVIPPFPISTPAAYAALAAERRDGARSTSRRLLLDELRDWGSIRTLAANDFHEPVEKMHPRLRRLRIALSREGAAPAILSGSGSALVGIFATSEERDRALNALSEEGDLTLIPTRTVGGHRSRHASD